MFEIDRALESAAKLLAQVPADEAEVHVESREMAATRFSGNAITQNTDEHTLNLRLRVVKDGRVGIATTNSFGPEALDRTIARALTAAEHASPDPKLLPMLASQPEYQSVDAWNEATAAADPKARAEHVGAGVKACQAKDFEAAGLLTTGGQTNLYANSKGVQAAYQASKASLTFSSFADEGSVEGYGQGVGKRLDELDSAGIAAEAVEKCELARNPQPIQPGHYDVVLERAAVSDLMLFLSWLGFASQAHVEGRSALCGKLGEQVFSPMLSLRADPYHPLQQGCPFDGEGFPTRGLQLIERGVPKELPHDRRTASALKAENTGHANQQPDANGPMPRCIVVEAGDSSVEEMIASTERGLLVSQFHYTNTVDPMAMSITGMTRAGLFLIEDGQIKHPVQQLRFTESLLRSLKAIEAVESRSELTAGGLFGGGMVLPAIKIKDFTFSSGTGF